MAYSRKEWLIMSINTNYNSNIFSMFPTSGSRNVSVNALRQNEFMSALLGQYGANTAPNLSVGLKTYLSDIKSAASALKSTLNSLTASGAKSIFNQKEWSASDSSVMAITVASGKTMPKDLQEAKFTVSNVAKAQQNASNALKADEIRSGWSSASSLTITDSNGKSHTFSVAPKASTNRSVQEDLAKQINSANTGVTASVSFDEKKGTSQLILTAKETGAENKFSVSGNLAQHFGISSATTNAENAVYTMNGETRISASNTIALADGVTATLKGTSNTSEISLVEKNNITEPQNAMRSLVNQFNKLMDAAKENINDAGASRLFDNLVGVGKTYSLALNRVGISFNKDGFMEIDAKKMEAAAQSGELEQFISSGSGNRSYGFANRLDRIASAIDSNPTSYLSTQAKKEVANASSQPSYFSNNIQSAAFASRLNRLYSVGMLFDSMF